MIARPGPTGSHLVTGDTSSEMSDPMRDPDVVNNVAPIECGVPGSKAKGRFPVPGTAADSPLEMVVPTTESVETSGKRSLPPGWNTGTGNTGTEVGTKWSDSMNLGAGPVKSGR